MNNALVLLREDLASVEEKFKNSMASEVGLINKVGQHLLQSGGKRIRPLLLMLCARLTGYRGRQHIAQASAIEFLHTATLLHDDVVDGAELRRGSPSANSVWGNQAAVLTGDFLFAKAFVMMVEGGNIRALQILSQASTLMAEGEMLQLIETGNLEVGEQSYLNIIEKKTAALFAATCRCGGILGGVEPAAEDALASFGLNIGLAFQLVDDALDYVAEEKVFGKIPGHDLAEGKMTLPLIHALANCSPKEKGRITEIVTGETMEEADLSYAMDLIRRTGGLEYSWQRAEELVGQAKSRLNIFSESPEKSALFELADYVVTRER
ncbi:MAG: polyprenyl synthetase family protein [Syntrophotaleaceae bacterium]